LRLFVHFYKLFGTKNMLFGLLGYNEMIFSRHCLALTSSTTFSK